MKLFVERICRTIKVRVYMWISKCYFTRSIQLLKLAVRMIDTGFSDKKINYIVQLARTAERKEYKWNHYANAELEELMAL